MSIWRIGGVMFDRAKLVILLFQYLFVTTDSTYIKRLWVEQICLRESELHQLYTINHFNVIYIGRQVTGHCEMHLK